LNITEKIVNGNVRKQLARNNLKINIVKLAKYEKMGNIKK